MSESQIAESVREAMDEATAGVRIPAGTAARARTKGRRRRAARGLLAVVPAVGLIAGVTVALHGGGSAPSHEASSVPGSSPTVQTDAYIIHHVEAALGSAGQLPHRHQRDERPRPGHHHLRGPVDRHRAVGRLRFGRQGHLLDPDAA